MKSISKIMIGLTMLACLAALAVSVYPGVLGDLLFMATVLSLFVIPVVGIAVFAGSIVFARRHTLRIGPYSVNGAAIVAAILLATLILLTCYVPRRIAFALSRSSFEPLVQNAPVSTHDGALNRRLGLYNVDKYAADPRGGVYFRVYTGGDGIGPDQMSYGFVHKPNPEGTPFGAAHYGVYALGGDWYWFEASDDWY